jgi:hypothetical protein
MSSDTTINRGESEHEHLSLEERVFELERQFGWARTAEKVAELDRKIAEEDAVEIAAEKAGDDA